MIKEQKEILSALQQLVGYELTKVTRAGDMECLQFGMMHTTDRKGLIREIGEYGIHLQCPWRFSKGSSILVGSEDLYLQPDENSDHDEEFNWDTPNGNLRDRKLKFFLKKEKCVVKSVSVDNVGGFELTFDNNIKLSVFPASSGTNEYYEFWRLLDNTNPSKKHFVVSNYELR